MRNWQWFLLFLALSIFLAAFSWKQISQTPSIMDAPPESESLLTQLRGVEQDHLANLRDLRRRLGDEREDRQWSLNQIKWAQQTLREERLRSAQPLRSSMDQRPSWSDLQVAFSLREQIFAQSTVVEKTRELYSNTMTAEDSEAKAKIRLSLENSLAKQQDLQSNYQAYIEQSQNRYVNNPLSFIATDPLGSRGDFELESAKTALENANLAFTRSQTLIDLQIERMKKLRGNLNTANRMGR